MFQDLYAAFNARDLDAVLEKLAPDVDWANGFQGGRVHGREAVRAYWTDQFEQFHPRVEATSVTEREDGKVEVAVHQMLYSVAEVLLDESHVRHVYTLTEDGLIARMDID
jgi:ketosteroid isomerase-like protein